jgi:phosphate starvation-inducible PhoH-like protein
MLPRSITPFYAARKGRKYNSYRKPYRAIVSIEPAGEEEVRCISVAASDHLYVTEQYIVTHNTTFAAGAIYIPKG